MTTTAQNTWVRDLSGTKDTIKALRVWQADVAIEASYLFFELESADGRIGVGEATVRREHQTVADIAQWLVEVFAEGRELAEVGAIVDNCIAATGPIPSQFAAAALSGLEQCLLDLRGQALGLPVYELLGGKVHDRIPLYANVNRSTFGNDRGPEGIAASASSAVDAGFTKVKIAPFDGVHPDSLPNGPQVRLGMERIAAVRREVGPAIEIFVNCHERLSPEIVRAILPELGDLGVVWFQAMYPTRVIEPHLDATLEDPPGSGNAPDTTFYPVSPNEYQELARLSAIPLAGAARGFGLPGYKEQLSLGVLTHVMTDVVFDGGIGLSRTIGQLIGAYGAKLSPHNPTGPIATIAAMHVCVATPAFALLEYQWGEVPFRDQLVTPGEYREGGWIVPSDTPGLGLTISHEGLKTHAQSVRRLAG